MIHDIGSNKFTRHAGKTITNAKQDGAIFVIAFSDGTTLQIYDSAKEYCEERYVTCDDDITTLIGEKFRYIEKKEYRVGEYPVVDTTREYCECVFVEVATDKDHITFCTHKEHNGYYGGIDLVIRESRSTNEKRLLLQKWHDKMIAVNDTYVKLGGVLEINVLEPFLQIVDQYTATVAAIIGDNEGWLDYWRMECDCGRDPQLVRSGVKGDIVLDSLDILFDIIIAYE